LIEAYVILFTERFQNGKKNLFVVQLVEIFNKQAKQQRLVGKNFVASFGYSVFGGK